MNTNLPAGFAARPVTLDDVAPVTAMFNAYSRWTIGRDQHDVEDIRIEWKTPDFNLASDTRLVVSPQGQPVGYIELWDMGEPHIRMHAWGMVLPEYQGRGLGGWMVDWASERARESVRLAPEGARVVLHQGVLSQNESANALLAGKGFQPVRAFYLMQIDLDRAPEAPVLPKGVTIRSIQPGEERIAIRCAFDSFHDHWGFIEEPFDNYANRWLHHLQNDKDYDPSLWFMAMDGEELAGVSLCYSHITEDPQMGWVGTLGVRRPWRRNGLGLALLLHSFSEFYQRGQPRAGLGVDATSLTGATRLYERAGMRVSRQTNLYELELRSGTDLMIQNVAEPALLSETK